MMGIRDLILRLRSLLAPTRAERDLHDELSFHIERETRKLMDQGVPARDARHRAHARFGSVTLAADQCRDERGTAFVDNTIRDVQYALRTFARGPLTAFTIVATVAIGLGVVAVLFTVLNAMVFRLDIVPNIAEMYSVERPQQADGAPPAFTRERFEALKAETQVFTDVYATLNSIDLRVDGRLMSVNLVSASFFPVVAIRPVMGRAFGPADDDRAGGSPVAVLSDRGWERHFKRDPHVLGRTVLVNGAPFEIVGVMPAKFRGLEVMPPDFWAPLSRAADFIPDLRRPGSTFGVEIVGRLKPGVSMEVARAQLAAWDANQSPAAASATNSRTMSIELLPRNGTVSPSLEVVGVFTPLFLAFGLILLIGCANVANLLLARAVARQKEIGIRLSLGASRRRIVRQLMTESVLLALAAAAGGYLVSRVALEAGVSWMMRVTPMDIGDVNLSVPAADWRVALFLVVGALAATAFFALMPALQATRVEPVRTLRGELVKDARPGRARNLLIGVQVFASALLLICASIFLRSALASAQFNPGFRTADTLLIDITNEPRRGAVLQALAGDPTLIAHAAVRPPFLALAKRAFADTGAGKTALSYKFVSAAYFDVLGIAIVRGRAFTAAEVDDHPVAIVSESIARALWPNGDGIGETLQLEADLTAPEFNGFLQVNPEANADAGQLTPRMVTVIGVSRAVAGLRITDVKEADIYLPTSLEIPKTSVVARVQGDPDLARQTLLNELTRIDPNIGGIMTMRSIARIETFFLRIAFTVSLILGGLALLLTVSGLFSVLSYLVEQRKKEIGLRMALGATSHSVTQLMLSQTARPVFYGLLLGAGLAAVLATTLIAMPGGALISSIVHMTDPVAYAAGIIVIIAACLAAAWIPATRASRVDPMQTLRQE